MKMQWHIRIDGQKGPIAHAFEKHHGAWWSLCRALTLGEDKYGRKAVYKELEEQDVVRKCLTCKRKENETNII